MWSLCNSGKAAKKSWTTIRKEWGSVRWERRTGHLTNAFSGIDPVAISVLSDQIRGRKRARWHVVNPQQMNDEMAVNLVPSCYRVLLFFNDLGRKTTANSLFCRTIYRIDCITGMIWNRKRQTERKTDLQQGATKQPGNDKQRLPFPNERYSDSIPSICAIPDCLNQLC